MSPCTSGSQGIGCLRLRLCRAAECLASRYRRLSRSPGTTAWHGSKERPGPHRWKVERTISWLLGHRRLAVRYERHGHLFIAFPTLAAALVRYKKLSRITT